MAYQKTSDKKLEYVFDPETDITEHETARLLPILIAAMKHAGSIYHIADGEIKEENGIKIIESLKNKPELYRHFKQRWT